MKTNTNKKTKRVCGVGLAAAAGGEGTDLADVQRHQSCNKGKWFALALASTVR